MAEKIWEGTRFKGGSWRYRIKMTLQKSTKKKQVLRVLMKHIKQELKRLAE